MATRIWIGTSVAGDWETAANWTGAAVPTDGDIVVYENSSQNCTLNLDQSAVTLAALIIKQSFTGHIGTATTYLQVGATLVDIGEHYGYGSPAGSGRIKVDLGAVASTVVVHNTASTPASGDTYLAPVRIKCNEATTDIYVRKGKVSIAAEAYDDVSALDEVHVGYVGGQDTDADVEIGAGVTLDELDMRGGKCVLSCSATLVAVDKGTLYTQASGAITTMTVEGGRVFANSTGTIGTLNANGGIVDFTRSEQARTVTTLGMKRGATLKYDPSRITVTNKLAPAEEMTVTCTEL